MSHIIDAHGKMLPLAVDREFLAAVCKQLDAAAVADIQHHDLARSLAPTDDLLHAERLIHGNALLQILGFQRDMVKSHAADHLIRHMFFLSFALRWVLLVLYYIFRINTRYFSTPIPILQMIRRKQPSQILLGINILQFPCVCSESTNQIGISLHNGTAALSLR